MEQLHNLNEYRNERIEQLKTTVLEVAHDALLKRSEGDFDVTLSKVDIAEIELFITPYNDITAPTPAHVVVETGIAIANYLKAESELPYTVDMDGLKANPPAIRIVKM